MKEKALLAISGKVLEKSFSLDAIGVIRSAVERALSERDVLLTDCIVTLEPSKFLASSFFMSAGFVTAPADDEDLQAAALVMRSVMSPNSPDEVVVMLGEDEPVNFLRAITGMARRTLLRLSGPEDAGVSEQLAQSLEGVLDIRELLSKEGVSWDDYERHTWDGWSDQFEQFLSVGAGSGPTPRAPETEPLGGGSGADVDEVARVVGADRRIGPKFLKAGPGFGGSCFKKDVLNLVYLCETFGLHTAAEYWMGVIKMNQHQQERIVSRLFSAMFNTLANKKIALFGFAFKADTGDTRETPAATVARLLAEEHVRVTVTDPKALDNARRDLADLSGIVYEADEYKAAEGADAIVLMTDWRHYPTLDWRRIYDSMRKPALVFDTRNCLDAVELKQIGFRVLNVGK